MQPLVILIIRLLFLILIAVDGHYIVSKEMLYLVFQGSVLGPLLFKMYTQHVVWA